MKSILVFYFPDTSVGRPFLVLWFSTCSISWYSSWGVIKIYKIVLNNTNHLVNYAIVFDIILPLKDWMVCIWITLSVRHIPSIRPDFVAVILATEGCIDSKISAWLHINWAYAVRNFGCCPMSTSCFVPFFTMWNDSENFCHKILGFQWIWTHFIYGVRQCIDEGTICNIF